MGGIVRGCGLGIFDPVGGNGLCQHIGLEGVYAVN